MVYYYISFYIMTVPLLNIPLDPAEMKNGSSGQVANAPRNVEEYRKLF